MGIRVDATRTRNDLRHMFDLWGIEQFSILREQEEYVSGGMKRGNGVTVSYLRKGSWQTVFCNHGNYQENMRSIFLFLDRVRIAEKMGIAYQGLSSTKDLVSTGPAKDNGNSEAKENFEDACDVLGVEPTASFDEIDRTYKVKVQYAHPDKGGDPEKFKRIQRAYEYVKQVKGVK